LGNFEIQPTLPSDLESIAALHKAQFSDHLLGQFSVSLLVDFYGMFLGNSIFLTARNSSDLLGFVLGGLNSQNVAIKGSFQKCRFWRILFESLFRPRVWVMAGPRILALPVRPSSPQSLYEMRLLSIAVRNEAKGSGVASGLVSGFENSILGYQKYGLSVLAENSRALAFYIKQGYVEEMRNGKSVFFWKSISADREHETSR